MDGMMSDMLNFVNSFLLIIWILSAFATALVMKKKGGIQPFILLLILITGPIGLLIWLFLINKFLD